MNHEEFKKILLSNKAVKKAYDNDEISYSISASISRARIAAGLTQEQLAERLNTKQSAIARLEAGKRLPSLNYLSAIASALSTDLIPPTFASIEERKSNITLTVETKSLDYERVPIKSFQVSSLARQLTNNSERVTSW